MKNITVLAIAWVVWFCVCWWAAGLELNAARTGLLFSACMTLFIGLFFTTGRCAEKGLLLKKIGESDD